jgi:hypothetical protein
MMVILEKVSLSASRSQPQQEMRTKQKKIPLRNFSRRGIAYQKENAKPELMGLSGPHRLPGPWQEPAPLSV